MWLMMSQPTIEERKLLWRLAYARAAFSEASEFAKLLLVTDVNDRFMKTALSISMTVAYTRPFKQKPKMRLDDSLVPAEYAEDHASMILHRDKLIVHRDINGPETEWGSVSDLVVDVGKDGVGFQPFYALVTDDLAERVKKLSQSLIAKMDDQIKPIAFKLIPHLPKQGKFILNLTDSGPWIEERDPQG